MKVVLGIYRSSSTSYPWRAVVFNSCLTGKGAAKEEAINDAKQQLMEILAKQYEEVLEVEI